MPRGGAFYVPFIPSHGNGAPGANTPRDNLYFDTSTTPHTSYVYNAGAWHAFGAVPSIDATSIQGVAVSNAAPADGNKLIYVQAATEYEPL